MMDRILEYLASLNFVLASESNLSLATGLASWKVSLESCQLQKTLRKTEFCGNALKLDLSELANQMGALVVRWDL